MISCYDSGKRFLLEIGGIQCSALWPRNMSESVQVSSCFRNLGASIFGLYMNPFAFFNESVSECFQVILCCVKFCVD